MGLYWIVLSFFIFWREEKEVRGKMERKEENTENKATMID
jgi:hypothetical protein